MKKIILVFGVIAISAGAYAQADSTSRVMSPLDMNNTQNQIAKNNPDDKLSPDDKSNRDDKTYSDGLLMQNGKIMKVKNGKLTKLDRDTTLSNGSKINSDGSYVKKDGTRMMMKEGQQMDMSGNLITMKTKTEKNMDYNHNTHNKSADKLHPDGVMMQGEKIMVYKNGKTTRLDGDITMSNGTKITSDGSYIKKDGTKMTLKEGQHMDMSGNIILMKTEKDNNMYLVPDSTTNKNK